MSYIKYYRYLSKQNISNESVVAIDKDVIKNIPNDYLAWLKSTKCTIFGYMGTTIIPYMGYDNEVILFNKCNIDFKHSTPDSIVYGGSIAHDQNPNECVLCYSKSRGYYYSSIQTNDVLILGKDWGNVLKILYKTNKVYGQPYTYIVTIGGHDDWASLVPDSVVGYLINSTNGITYTVDEFKRITSSITLNVFEYQGLTDDNNLLPILVNGNKKYAIVTGGGKLFGKVVDASSKIIKVVSGDFQTFYSQYLMNK